jgi:hypothetical protein
MPWRITEMGTSPNQSLHATISRISIENDATIGVSNLTGRKQVHGKTRNMRNSRNIKIRSRKGSPTRDKERRAISSDNTKRRIKRSKRGHDGRMRSYMKRISRIQNPRGCT